MGKKTKDKAATATTPAAVTTKIGGTVTEIDRAEKMIDRLEGERIKADKALKEQAEHLGRVIGILKMMDNRGILNLEKAGQPVQAPKAEAKPAETADEGPGLDYRREMFRYSGWPDVVKKNLQSAGLYVLLGGLLFEEIKVLSEDLFQEVRANAVERVRRAFQAEELESDGPGDIYSLVMGLRSCRLGEECRLW